LPFRRKSGHKFHGNGRFFSNFLSSERTAVAETDADFSALLDLAMDGDEDAAQQLVTRYRDPLLRAIRRSLDRRLRPLFDSADFEQMVWLSVFRHKELLERLHRPEELEKYVIGMARKKIASEARRRLVRPQHNLNRERSLENVIDEVGDIRDRGTPVGEAVSCAEQTEKFFAALPQRQRETVELRLKGLTKREIAIRLDIPERTLRHIWTKIARAWRKLFSKSEE
jgi:RNA polymerase sigma factor (sigma-70 family)